MSDQLVPADRPIIVARPRTHPLDLPPDAVRTIRDLTVTAAQRAVVTQPARPRGPVRSFPLQHVESPRVEPVRSFMPWLSTTARVILIILACAGILALGYVTILGYVAWYSQ
jgi:hypothetical protein